MTKSPTLFFFVLLTTGFQLAASPLKLPDVDDVYPFVPDWQNSRILHIGDSHVAFGFKSRLARHFHRAGASFHQEAWVGSRCKSWVKSGKMRNLIEEYGPSVVLVTLGTNEMKNRKPERILSWIRALISKIGRRTCYWVGPPPLLDDRYQYNEMLKSNVGPCRYFDSRVLDVHKRADGKFHLTRAEGENWAELIWKWMNGR